MYSLPAFGEWFPMGTQHRRGRCAEGEIFLPMPAVHGAGQTHLNIKILNA